MHCPSLISSSLDLTNVREQAGAKNRKRWVSFLAASADRKVLRDSEGQARAMEVAGYFDRIDGRVDTWWFETVSLEERKKSQPFLTPRFHRTLSDWVEMIAGTGLLLERLVEPCASSELAAAEPVVADTRVAPMSLLIRLRKPN